MGAIGFSRRSILAGAASLAATARLPAAPRPGPGVRSGLDRLLTSDAGRLAGKRVGLLTHDAAVTADGRRGVDAIAALPGVKLAVLFGPEHGLVGAAAAGEHVGDARDGKTGVPIYSLYGARRTPEPTQLAGLDLLLIDLQDVGLRCYTYAGTALAAIKVASEVGLKVLVLDRPNPLGGLVSEGPSVDEGFVSPVTALPVPYRHGLTLGELAGLFAPRGARVEVSRLDSWERTMGTRAFGPGGLPFVAPSPNLPSPAAILAYAASVLIEGTNLSEGRGTETPFEQIGAPWLDGAKLARTLGRARLPGVRFAPARFVPTASKHAGKRCGGVRLTVTDETRFRGFEIGLALVSAIRRQHPPEFGFLPGKPPFFDLLAGRSLVREGIEAGRSRAAILRDCEPDLARFRARSGPARLY